ncbi:hypothetical protein [Actinomadura flavalba]|uniref:hypothetical protein n=1 Tax=Actinomadura flavalba TaxID=1120938 RepID=UPI000364F614|nr:hypothetical protein [Actinomadura flavalba]
MSAGRLLARLTIAPALLIVAWFAVALPLLFAGMLRPGPAIILFVPVAVLVLWVGLRRAAPDEDVRPVPWWSALGVLGVALVFLGVQIAMASEQLMVRRDPASYMQFGIWLADHGSLPIPRMEWAFGGPDPHLRFNSPAFYSYTSDDVITPQFMAGLPLLITLGVWIGGVKGGLLIAPVLGACAVLAFGGLTARLIGPRWAPAGALALALTLPMIWASRSTYSELPALVLLLGGLALLHDARHGRAVPRAFLGGLALGLILLVRIDALRDLLPVIAVAGLYIGLRRPSGAPLAAGLTLGAGAGLAEGFLLSRPYLRYLNASLDPLLLLVAVLIAATALLIALLRWSRTRAGLGRAGAAVARGPLPAVAAALTVLAAAAFAARPLFQTVRRVPRTPDDQSNAQFIEQVQRSEGLPIDGARQYSELSLHWVVWYLGIPLTLLAVVGAALLARRLLRGDAPEWLLPFALIAFVTFTTLLRPAITPDHPWASRRLLGVVIPGAILLGLWAAAWGMRRVRRAGYGPWTVRVVAVVTALVLLVPLPLASAGVATKTTEKGELAALNRMCAGLGGAGRSVIVVSGTAANRYLQVIRGMCGLPAARVAGGLSYGDVRLLAERVWAAGRRPVILGEEARQVAPYGTPVQIMRLDSRQDGRTLTTPPTSTWGLGGNVWISEPARP